MNLTGPWLGSDPEETDGVATGHGTGNPFDEVADLDLASAELTQRAATLDREYRDVTEALDAITADIEAVSGTGTAEDGAVEVIMDGTGRISAVHLDPRALRLGSIGRLEEAIVAAAGAAADDLAQRLDDGLGDPVRELYAAMPELSAMLGERRDDPFGARVAERRDRRDQP